MTGVTAVIAAAVGAALLVWPAPPRGAIAAPRSDAWWWRLRRSRSRTRVRRARPRAAGALLGAALGLAVALVSTWACGVAAGLAGATATRLVRRARAAGRGRRDLDALAAMLRGLARDLRAGTAPADAVAHAVDAAPSSVSGVAAGIIGPPGLPVAPRISRSVSDGSAADVRARLRAGWDLSARHGVPLADVVGAVADDLADRARSADARVAQVAGPAVSGYVLAALPAAGLLMGAGMGTDPLAVLTGSAVGATLLVAGTGLCCCGLLWADRIVRR